MIYRLTGLLTTAESMIISKDLISPMSLRILCTSRDAGPIAVTIPNSPKLRVFTTVGDKDVTHRHAYMPINA